MGVWIADPHGVVSVPALSARAHGGASDLRSATRGTTPRLGPQGSAWA